MENDSLISLKSAYLMAIEHVPLERYRLKFKV